ncbi:MAG: leucine-rich repeat protein, partial [Clostridia bacterium]
MKKLFKSLIFSSVFICLVVCLISCSSLNNNTTNTDTDTDKDIDTDKDKDVLNPEEEYSVFEDFEGALEAFTLAKSYNVNVNIVGGDVEVQNASDDTSGDDTSGDDASGDDASDENTGGNNIFDKPSTKEKVIVSKNMTSLDYGEYEVNFSDSKVEFKEIKNEEDNVFQKQDDKYIYVNLNKNGMNTKTLEEDEAEKSFAPFEWNKLFENILIKDYFVKDGDRYKLNIKGKKALREECEFYLLTYDAYIYINNNEIVFEIKNKEDLVTSYTIKNLGQNDISISESIKNCLDNVIIKDNQYFVPAVDYSATKPEDDYFWSNTIKYSEDSLVFVGVGDRKIENLEILSSVEGKKVIGIQYDSLTNCNNLLSITIPSSIDFEYVGRALCSSYNYYWLDLNLNTVIRFEEVKEKVNSDYTEGKKYCKNNYYKSALWGLMTEPYQINIFDCNNNNVDEEGYEIYIRDSISYAIKDNKAMVLEMPASMYYAEISSTIKYNDITIPVISINTYIFSKKIIIDLPESISEIGIKGIGSGNNCSTGEKLFVQSSEYLNGAIIYTPNEDLSFDLIRKLGEEFLGEDWDSQLEKEFGEDYLELLKTEFFSGANFIDSVSKEDDKGYGYCLDSDGNMYRVKDNNAELYSININNSSLNIASNVTYNNVSCPVTAIIDFCASYSYLNSLEESSLLKAKSITIPEGIISIGESAFYGFYQLNEINIPDSVVNIGTAAFRIHDYCNYELRNGLKYVNDWIIGIEDNTLETLVIDAQTKGIMMSSLNYDLVESRDSRTCISYTLADNIIKEITLDKNNPYLSVVDNVLYNKNETTLIYCPRENQSTTLEISESVTEICNLAFINNSNLEVIALPENLEKFGVNVFKNCNKLNQVTLPSKLDSIKYGTFENCVCLKEITIPDGVKEIYANAFNNCSCLTDVVLSDSVRYIYEDAFANCIALININLNENIRTSSSFSNCKSIKKMVLYKYLKFLPWEAFKNCESLEEIILPEGLVAIGYDAFDGCTKLTSIIIPSTVTEIGSGAFANSGLTEIILPEGLLKISNNAFDGCENLTSINIPSTVTEIGIRAFANSGLTEITLFEGLIKISNNAFDGCENLTSINIPSTVTEIGSAFANSGLTEVILADNTKIICNEAFKNIETLISITIPNSVTSIGNGAFENCTGLTSITIPNSVTSIGNGVFKNCTGLTNITIPNGITRIEDYIF